MNYAEQYFKAVYTEFSTRIKVVSELVKEHPGEKGKITETAIIQILTDYLPKRFSIGSGFVIDSEGNKSRQCDIVVYDTETNLSMFGGEHPFIFPVESVYAVFEIKTTLDDAAIQDACNHISSVKHLKNHGLPTIRWETGQNGMHNLVRYEPNPPLGIIIGYQSNTKNLETIKNRFSNALRNETALFHPTMAISLREGFLMRYKDIAQTPDSLDFNYFAVNLRDKDGNFVLDQNEKVMTYTLDRSSGEPELEEIHGSQLEGYSYDYNYKLCLAPNFGPVLGDAPRLLLSFLFAIQKILNLYVLSTLDHGQYISTKLSQGNVF